MGITTVHLNHVDLNISTAIFHIWGKTGGYFQDKYHFPYTSLYLKILELASLEQPILPLCVTVLDCAQLNGGRHSTNSDEGRWWGRGGVKTDRSCPPTKPTVWLKPIQLLGGA